MMERMDDSPLGDIRKLRLFDEMAESGANRVAEHMSRLTDMDTRMEVTKIDVMDIPDIETHLGSEKQVGVYIELIKPPNGTCSSRSASGATASWRR